MFKTNRRAELLLGPAKGPDAVQFWSFVEMELFYPWFYVQVADRDGESIYRSMLLVPSVPLLEDVIAGQSDVAWLEQVLLVTPAHMNKTDQWLMEPLLELSSVRDSHGIEIGHHYRVKKGRTYSTTASENTNSEPHKRLVFSAVKDLRCP